MLPTPFPTLVDGERGSIYMSTLRDYVRGVASFPASTNQPITAGARSGSANGQFNAVTIEAPTDSYLEIFSLYGVNGAAVAADVLARQCVVITQFIDGQRQMMRRPVNCAHVFGTQLNPFFLDDPFSEPILLPPNGVLKFDFINPSASGAMSFSFAAESRRINMEALRDPKIKAEMDALVNRRRKVSPVWLPLASDSGTPATPLNVPGITLAQSAYGDTNFITFNSSPSQVLITRILGSFVTAGGAGDATNGFAVDLFDGRTYRQLNTQPIVFSCAAGSAAFPFILPTPIVVESNQVIKARVYNLVTNGTTDVFLTMQGVAVDD
jgi:hypothetical protein